MNKARDSFAHDSIAYLIHTKGGSVGEFRHVGVRTKGTNQKTTPVPLYRPFIPPVIDGVDILDHGNEVDGQYLGSDPIDPNDPNWKRLSNHITGPGRIKFHGCSAGRAASAIGRLVRSAGRRIVAYTHDTIFITNTNWLWGTKTTKIKHQGNKFRYDPPKPTVCHHRP